MKKMEARTATMRKAGITVAGHDSLGFEVGCQPRAASIPSVRPFFAGALFPRPNPSSPCLQSGTRLGGPCGSLL